MLKILVSFFSQGGTTKKIAEKISRGLQSRQLHADFYNIADDHPPSMADYDIFGIGSPVYIFRPPI